MGNPKAFQLQDNVQMKDFNQTGLSGKLIFVSNTGVALNRQLSNDGNAHSARFRLLTISEKRIHFRFLGVSYCMFIDATVVTIS